MEVHFRHAPPENVTPYRQFFQAPVVFNAERTALVFRTQWLSSVVPGADSQLRRYFQGYVDAMVNRLERGFEGKVYTADPAPGGHQPLHPGRVGDAVRPATPDAESAPAGRRHQLPRPAEPGPPRSGPGNVARHHQRHRRHRQPAGLHQCQRLRARVRPVGGPAARRMAQDRRGRGQPLPGPAHRSRTLRRRRGSARRSSACVRWKLSSSSRCSARWRSLSTS
jgi:hypothetical protein